MIKIDGKYIDVVSIILYEHIFDKKGNKSFSLFIIVYPENETEEL